MGDPNPFTFHCNHFASTAVSLAFSRFQQLAVPQCTSLLQIKATAFFVALL
jgi:hypothetical protein